MSRPTCMTIDLAALQHNVMRVRELAPHSSIMAMVKANAYGHGLVRVAEALPNVDAFGVASLEEAIKLREAGIKLPIILMEGVFTPEELNEAAQHDCRLVVHHFPHIEMLEKTSSSKPYTVWLKINTGMHRLGVHIDDVNEAYRRLSALPNVKKPIGLMTHFAEADLLDSSQTAIQMDLFDQVTLHYPGPKSLANSAGILAWHTAHREWIRPGLILYGASPFRDKTALEYNLKPVMTFWSRLIAVTPVKKGGRVGYGGTWTAPEDMSIGIVGVGYGDGYPQYAQNGTPVLVKDIVCPLVGRVSMDMLAVDLRSSPEAAVGDPVVLWGKGLPVETVAKMNTTSAWELLTRMTPRPKIDIVT